LGKKEEREGTISTTAMICQRKRRRTHGHSDDEVSDEESRKNLLPGEPKGRGVDEVSFRDKDATTRN